MAKREQPGDTSRSKTVTTADLEQLCGRLEILHDKLAERLQEMQRNSIRSVRFDGGGMGEGARRTLAAFTGKLGEAIESQL